MNKGGKEAQEARFYISCYNKNDNVILTLSFFNILILLISASSSSLPPGFFIIIYSTKK